jgi:uncharacterized protein (DUF1684 family)
MIKKRFSYGIFALAAGFFLMWFGSAAEAGVGGENEDFIKGEMKWREERDKSMRSPTSWLTIAGLYWLDEGENSFGTDKTNTLVLPSRSAPDFCGTFILEEDKVRIVTAKGAGIKIENEEIKEKILTGDNQGKPDILELNDLRMWVIKRGDRFAIRMRDFNAPAFKKYEGLDFFPPNETFRINGNFVPYDKEKIIEVTTVAGTTAEMVSPGYILFTMDGKKHRLEAFKADETNTTLFIIFKDLTNGKETYEKGRFMIANVLDNGKVNLNFNRAYNPPCNYTPYATCPVPPPEANWLKVRIEAGEKAYAGRLHH